MIFDAILDGAASEGPRHGHFFSTAFALLYAAKVCSPHRGERLVLRLAARSRTHCCPGYATRRTRALPWRTMLMISSNAWRRAGGRATGSTLPLWTGCPVGAPEGVERRDVDRLLYHF